MIPKNDSWVNDFIIHVLDLAEAVGDIRNDVLFLKFSTLEEEWSSWCSTQLQSLIKIMANRRLISRVAGYEGEELLISPNASRLHEAHMQRMSAFEEEEESNFIEEEVESERIQELAIQVKTARLSGPPPPPSMCVIATPNPSVKSLRRMYGGDDVRIQPSV